MLVDLRPKKLTGKAAEAALAARPTSPATRTACRSIRRSRPITSGIRLGSPACTSRGFGVAEFRRVGELIVAVLDGLAGAGEAGNAAVEASVRGKVEELTRRFPIY